MEMPKDAMRRHDTAQAEALQMVAEGIEKRYPAGMVAIAVTLVAHKHGLPLPEDALAWATGGKMSDDDYLPKDRPSTAEVMRRLDVERGRLRAAMGLD